MSYDIYLEDPVSCETLRIPAHLMSGGIVKAEKMPDGSFVQAPDDEAHLNVTYNYGEWYSRAFDKDDEYYDSIRMRKSFEERKGIRTIYGMSGATSINEIKYAISKISNKEWSKDLDVTQKSLDDKYDEDCRWWANLSQKDKKVYESFGMKPKRDTLDSYWTATRENALRPLYQLLSIAQMRPDGVWDGD